MESLVYGASRQKERTEVADPPITDHRPARGDCDVTQPVISFLMGPEMLRGIERRVEFAAVLPGVSSLTAGGA